MSDGYSYLDEPFDLDEWECYDGEVADDDEPYDPAADAEHEEHSDRCDCVICAMHDPLPF